MDTAPTCCDDCKNKDAYAQQRCLQAAMSLAYGRQCLKERVNTYDDKYLSVLSLKKKRIANKNYSPGGKRPKN